MSNTSNILLIYTGGTIGMIESTETQSLHPFDFNHVTKEIPELLKLNCRIEAQSFEQPIDSSDVSISTWDKLSEIILNNYTRFDGFVILHGTDTMAYTAAALSFMLENLNKPVILTGSQLPIGVLRTDGKENMLTAIEIASLKNEDGTPKLSEVAIYFEYKLFRGNRVHKVSTSNFKAFDSPNYPILAEAGVHIEFNHNALGNFCSGEFSTNKMHNPGIDVLPIFPGLCRNQAERALSNPDISDILLLTYGAGNGPSFPWFIDAIEKAVSHGKIIINITQCLEGKVNMKLYNNGRSLMDRGVLSGVDITMETALTKLMYLHGKGYETEQIKSLLTTSIRGEISV